MEMHIGIAEIDRELGFIHSCRNFCRSCALGGFIVPDFIFDHAHHVLKLFHFLSEEFLLMGEDFQPGIDCLLAIVGKTDEVADFLQGKACFFQGRIV